jgi:hypothetical protein
VSARRPGQLLELGAAGKAVGQDRGACPRASHGWQQGCLGDRDRDVVVAALDAEVARQAAAAADRGNGSPRGSKQRGVRRPAAGRAVMAVRLRYPGDARQVRR